MSKKILFILIEIISIGLVLFTAIYLMKIAIWFDPALLTRGYGRSARLHRYLLAHVDHNIIRAFDFLFGILIIVMVLLYIRKLLRKK